MDEARYVSTRTPLRISFAGGGTDLPDYYEREYGAVLSTAINRYIYVTVKPLDPLFNAQYRLNYSITEHVNSLEEIKNDIARECLRKVPVETPIYVSTIADIPAMSGLGSSSSFAVGLLNALHAYRGEHVSGARLAEEAAAIEMEELERPIGKQDHYAAAIGGMNFFSFHPNGSVTILPQAQSPSILDGLFSHMMLFWTGIHRDASEVLGEQKKNTGARIAELASIRDLAESLRDSLAEKYCPETVGTLIHENWQLKRKLAGTISNGLIDGYYTAAMQAGALGGKLCGAGGGGFLLFIVAPDAQEAVRNALSELTEVAVGYEPHGSLLL
ncbi:MAG: GHMP kinase [Alphaproteobacteria bacterium]|nr:GHMP kinase [Alphaproteobacteria bacterium]